MRNPLERVPPTDVQQPIAKDRPVFLVRKRKRLSDPRPRGDAAVKLRNLDDRHLCLGQETDGMVAFVGYDEIDIAHFTGHQIAEDLPLAVDEQFVAEGHTLKHDKHDGHARAFVDERRVCRICPAMAAKVRETADLFGS